jgi:hypothetical protein
MDIFAERTGSAGFRASTGPYIVFLCGALTGAGKTYCERLRAGLQTRHGRTRQSGRSDMFTSKFEKVRKCRPAAAAEVLGDDRACCRVAVFLTVLVTGFYGLIENTVR